MSILYLTTHILIHSITYHQGEHDRFILKYVDIFTLKPLIKNDKRTFSTYVHM